MRSLNIVQCNAIVDFLEKMRTGLRANRTTPFQVAGVTFIFRDGTSKWSFQECYTTGSWKEILSAMRGDPTGYLVEFFEAAEWRRAPIPNPLPDCPGSTIEEMRIVPEAVDVETEAEEDGHGGDTVLVSTPAVTPADASTLAVNEESSTAPPRGGKRLRSSITQSTTDETKFEPPQPSSNEASDKTPADQCTLKHLERRISEKTGKMICRISDIPRDLDCMRYADSKYKRFASANLSAQTQIYKRLLGELPDDDACRMNPMHERYDPRFTEVIMKRTAEKAMQEAGEKSVPMAIFEMMKARHAFEHAIAVVYEASCDRMFDDYLKRESEAGPSGDRSDAGE